MTYGHVTKSQFKALHRAIRAGHCGSLPSIFAAWGFHANRDYEGQLVYTGGTLNCRGTLTFILISRPNTPGLDLGAYKRAYETLRQIKCAPVLP